MTEQSNDGGYAAYFLNELSNRPKYATAILANDKVAELIKPLLETTDAQHLGERVTAGNASSGWKVEPKTKGELLAFAHVQLVDAVLAQLVAFGNMSDISNIEISPIEAANYRMSQTENVLLNAYNELGIEQDGQQKKFDQDKGTVAQVLAPRELNKLTATKPHYAALLSEYRISGVTFLGACDTRNANPSALYELAQKKRPQLEALCHELGITQMTIFPNDTQGYDPENSPPPLCVALRFAEPEKENDIRTLSRAISAIAELLELPVRPIGIEQLRRSRGLANMTSKGRD